MKPIGVRAHLEASVMLPGTPPALDALLMAAVAIREGFAPLGFGHREDIAIPIDQERGIYLASVGQYEAEVYERRFINRKFPMLEAQMLGGSKMRSINIRGGAAKSYRIPTEATHLKNDVMEWFAIGSAAEVRELLSWVHYLGKKRSVGLGRVAQWEVQEVDPWDGFPVLRDGRPLRPLPLDWPGLGDFRVEQRVLVPPYWERWREEPCAC